MTAQTASSYYYRKLTEWLNERMTDVALSSVESPADGPVHWRRIGQYHAYKEVLDKMRDLDKE